MNRQLSRQQLTVLILGLMATGIGQSLVFALLAPLGREVHLSEVQITSLIAMSSLSFALTAPRWGRLSDRLGRKPVMITGLVGYTLGTVLFASAFYAGLVGLVGGTALYVLLAATRCAQASVMSATNPAASAYAADHSGQNQRTRTMARIGTANSLGTILGPAVTGALAALGLLAPLYFAAALAALSALLIWRRLPLTGAGEQVRRPPSARLRYTDPRIALFLATAVGLFVGFAGIQQTLGFALQDKLGLSGIQTAQLTGAAMMVSALFTLLVQVTVMQRVNLRPTLFIRLGLIALLTGAAIISEFQSFPVLAVGMAFMGTGMALCMPSIAAGASLAVTPAEQGGAAGLVSSCPPLGFAMGPLCAGALYQIDGRLAPLFSASVFFLVLLMVILRDRQPS